jgi:fermentation-respiration switch protein FrsA (DUF1100 family)
MFFQPHRQRILTPETFGLAYEEVRFKTADGTVLFGWFLPAQGNAAGTIMFLHGNAENISTHVSAVAWLPPRGFNVLLVDYRGYGASAGRPSLAGAQQDIDAAMQMLLARSDVDTNRIVVYGQSLGGALAAYNVAYSQYRGHVRALVIESAFSSYTGITREKLAATWLTWPFQWLASLTVDETFSPLPAMKLISPIPLLVIHGDQDAIVPIRHGQRLYDSALDPKQLWVIPGAGHIQGMRQGMWRDRFVAYLHEVLK